MINLLPTEQLTALQSDYRQRRLVVIGSLILAWLAMAAIIIVVFSLLLATKRQAVANELAVQKQALAQAQTGLTSEQTARLAADVKLLTHQAAGQIQPTALVKQILAVKPSGIKIDQLTLGESGVQLSGIASSRRVLLGFVDSLRADKTFSAVDSPVSNLIKDSNVEFNLIIKTF